MTFNELEQECAKLRASLVEANRFSTELATKLATAGHYIGFRCDQSSAEIAAQCRLRLRVLDAPPSPIQP
jgi:hypothetical protein